MDADRQTNDLSGPYLVKAANSAKSQDAAEMEQFLAGSNSGTPAVTAAPPDAASGDPGRALPEAKPLRAETSDTLGRVGLGVFKTDSADKRKASTMRNVAEMPSAAVKGVENAVQHALGWAINPLADWFNDNVLDTRYEHADPQTPVGKLTASATEFLSGFIPALKGFRGVGITDKVAAPMAAGALAAFAVQDPSAGRLSDFWKQTNLPENILTDYLSSKPNDSEMEARFKNALEGTGIGMLAEGVLLGARVLRSAFSMRGAKQAETTYLRDKYGEIDDQTYAKIVGDPSKPSVEMVVHEPSEAGAKIVAGAEETQDIAARTLVKGIGRPRKASDAEISAAAQSAGMSRRDFLKATAAVAVSAATKGGIVGQVVKATGEAAPAAATTGHMALQNFFDFGGHGEFYGYSPLGNLPGFMERWKGAGLSDAELADGGADGARAATKFVEKYYPDAVISGDKITAEQLAAEGSHYSHDWKAGDRLFTEVDGEPIEQWLVEKEAGHAGVSMYDSENFVYEEAHDIAKSSPTARQIFEEHGVSSNAKGLTKRGKETLQEMESEDPEALDVLYGKIQSARMDDALAGLPANVRMVAVADRVANGGQLTEAEAKEFPSLVDLAKAKAIAAGKDAALAPPQSKDYSVYVNFEKFDEPNEIKKAIGIMAEHGKGTIEEAQRGVITHVETQKLADDLGMTVTELLERRKGQAFNAEEAVAARQLWAASAERLVETAKIAAGKNAGDLDQYAFRKALAIHSAIQAEVIGARTEGARALSAWKIPIKGGSIEKARAIDQIMGAMGGANQSAEMARRIAILAETNASPAAIGEFAAKGATATTIDAVREAWVNGLLSNPKTHIVNITSNALVAFASLAERQVAGGIRAITGGEGVEMGEAAASAYGMISGVNDAWRMMAKAIKTGQSSWTFNKMDLPSAHAISADAFAMSKDTALGRFVDFAGEATRVPTRLLGAEDEFFKTIGYRMELHAQAYRTAVQEGKTGYEMGKRMGEIVANPPEHIMINSADAALYNTFTNETGKFGQAVMRAREGVPALTLVLPFIRTPVNIFRFAMERTPLAPLVSQWRADVAAGGARADLALARMSTGTVTMLTAMNWADNGILTGAGFRGGKDTGVAEAEQRQGMLPYSIKVGNRWYSYNRADPFGMTMGFAASIAEAVKKGEMDQDAVDEWQEVVAMSIAAVSNVAINKTYLQGLAQLSEVLTDPKRYTQAYVDNLFASFLPATSLMSAVKNVKDPVAREVNDPTEAIMSRIAGLSEKLTPRRDLWGKEMRPSETGLGKAFDFVTPVMSKEEEPTPVDKEMVRMNQGMERIGKQTTFDGVHANMRFYPKAYDDYTRLAGNDLKSPGHSGMGAKDYLNSVIDGSHPVGIAYNMMSDETRKSFIQGTIQDFRKMAQRQVLADPKHSAFAAEIQRLKEIHQGAQMPVMQ